MTLHKPAGVKRPHRLVNRTLAGERLACTVPSMTHQNGAPGRAPGPHASRPRIAETMQRVMACAVETDRLLRSVRGARRAGVADVVSGLLRDIEHPNRNVRENVLRGCLQQVASLVETETQTVYEAMAATPVGMITDEEDIVAYMTRAVATKGVRGRQKQRVIEIAKHGLAVGKLRDTFEHGEARNRLETQWQNPVFAANIDGVVDSLAARGINGEALAWSVIARESLQHILLVKREANRMARMWPERKADDLVGYGWRGLRLALRSYNPETAWFSTYACPKIRGAIRDGVRSEHHLPKRLNTFVNKAERAKDELSAILGRHPTQAEIAERLETEVERVRQLATYATPASLYTGEDDHGIQIAGRDDVETSAMASIEREALAGALAHLPEEEATAVRLLVMEEISMQEARTRTGASSKQLRARRDRGLATLRDELGETFEQIGTRHT